MPYDLDETLAAGDDGHLDHHIDLAVAVNDIDARITEVEAIGGVVHVDSIGDVEPGDYPVDTLIVQRTGA